MPKRKRLAPNSQRRDVANGETASNRQTRARANPTRASEKIVQHTKTTATTTTRKQDQRSRGKQNQRRKLPRTVTKARVAEKEGRIEPLEDSNDESGEGPTDGEEEFASRSKRTRREVLLDNNNQLEHSLGEAREAGNINCELEQLKQAVGSLQENMSIILEDIQRRNMANEQRARETSELEHEQNSVERDETFGHVNASGEYHENRSLHRQVQFAGGLATGEQIPQKTKIRIWQNKYVDFADLLNPEDESNYSLTICNNNSNPTLSLSPKQKKVLSDFEWITAWDIFMAIYTQKYPHELQDLLTYSQSIKRMMLSNSNWRYYDKQFRLSREHSLCSWLTVRIDLQLAAMNTASNSRFQRRENSKSGTAQHVPLGYCFKFHRRELFCTSRQCKYKHECPRCNRMHAMYRWCNETEGGKKQAGKYKAREQNTNAGERKTTGDTTK